MELKDASAFVGIGVSLAIGVRNWWVTANIRTGTIKLEEFRSQIRDPLQRNVDKLGSIREALVALRKPNALNDDELKSEISKQLALLEFLTLDMSELFKHADSSAFAKGRDWTSTFAARLTDCEDELGAIVGINQIDRIQVGASLMKTDHAITSVCTDLRKKFEAEVRRLMPFWAG